MSLSATAVLDGLAPVDVLDHFLLGLDAERGCVDAAHWPVAEPVRALKQAELLAVELLEELGRGGGVGERVGGRVEDRRRRGGEGDGGGERGGERGEVRDCVERIGV